MKKKSLTFTILVSLALVGTALFIACNHDEEGSVVNTKQTPVSKYILDRNKGEYVFTYDDGEVFNVLRGENFYDVIDWQSIVNGNLRFDADVILDYGDSDALNIIANEDKKNIIVISEEKDSIVFTDVEQIANGIKFNAIRDRDTCMTFTMLSDDFSIKNFWSILGGTCFLPNPFATTQSCLDPASWVAIGIFLATVAYNEYVRYCQRKIENEVAKCVENKKCARRTPCGATCYDCKKNG